MKRINHCIGGKLGPGDVGPLRPGLRTRPPASSRPQVDFAVGRRRSTAPSAVAKEAFAGVAGDVAVARGPRCCSASAS